MKVVAWREGRWEDVTIVEVVGWREGDGRM